MNEPTREEVISIVSSIFDVKDIEPSLETLQFEIQDYDFKAKFVQLAHTLEARNLICRLQKHDNSLFVLVNRFPPQKKRKFLSSSWTPRLLFSLVVALVMIDGYYRTLGVNSLVFISEPVDMAILYTFSLLGILGIHEAGHLIAAKMHRLKSTWPYFIPGIPIFGIPTFGAFIQARGMTVNRDILFDVAIAGPIAGLVIAIIVSIFGAYTSPVLDEAMLEALPNDSLVTMNENILMKLSLAMFGKGVEGTQVLMSPIMFAAWLGFLITFLNLLPAWQLDGGHMARTLMGIKHHKYATYASMGVLVLLGYWFMAMFILILSSRNPGAMPSDDVSPLSSNRKKMYVVVIVLAFLCAPLPDQFFALLS